MLKQVFSRFPRAAWILFGVGGALFLLFLGGVLWLWVSLPMEGVKLHGNVNTGVDLLGERRDLLWFGLVGVLIFWGNSLLAWLIAPRERAAAMFLLSSTIPVLLFLVVAVTFLADLNKLV